MLSVYYYHPTLLFVTSLPLPTNHTTLIHSLHLDHPQSPVRLPRQAASPKQQPALPSEWEKVTWRGIWIVMDMHADGGVFLLFLLATLSGLIHPL